MSDAESGARWLACPLLFLLLGLALGHLPFAPSEFTLNGLITVGLGMGALRLLSRPLEWRIDPPFIGLGLLMAWTLLRSITGPSLYLGALELGREIPLMVLAWTLSSRAASDEEPARGLRLLGVASLAVVAAACVPEVTGTTDMPESWADPALYQALTFRLTSVFDNPNLLGVFLAGFIALSLHGALTAGSREAMGWGAVFLVCTTLMLFTFSRGGWVGALAGLSLAALHLRTREARPVYGRRVGLLLVGLLPGVLGGHAALRERLTESGKAGELGIHQRLAILRGTLVMIREHALVGAGTNSYELFLSRHRDFGGFYPKECHAQPLQVAAELGLIGLSGYLLLMVGLLGQGLRAGKGDPGARSALAAFLVASCFISSGRYLALKILGWMLVGWAAAPPAGPPRRVPGAVRGILGLLVVMTSLYVWGLIAVAGTGEAGLRVASRGLPFADDLLFLRAVRAYRSGRSPEGRELLKQAVVLNPAQGRYPLELARDALMRDELVEARDWVARCRELDPWSEEGMLLEAQLALKENDPRRAILLLETGLRTNPQYLRINRSTYPTIVFMLVALHRHAGDPARAAELEKSFSDLLPKTR